MHARYMRYLLVGAAALVAGLLIAGSPVQSLLPLLLLLACPLMMVVMMRGMGGHGSGHEDGSTAASVRVRSDDENLRTGSESRFIDPAVGRPRREG